MRTNATLEFDPTLEKSALEKGTLVEIPLEAVDDLNPRIGYDPDAGALRESIQYHGLQTPIIVAPLPGGRYRVVAGRRRLTAVRELRRNDQWGETIEAVVRNDFLIEIEILENAQRAELNPFQEAALYLDIGKARGMRKASEIAKHLHLSTRYVQRMYAVNFLDPRIKQACLNLELELGPIVKRQVLKKTHIQKLAEDRSYENQKANFEKMRKAAYKEARLPCPELELEPMVTVVQEVVPIIQKEEVPTIEIIDEEQPPAPMENGMKHKNKFRKKKKDAPSPQQTAVAVIENASPRQAIDWTTEQEEIESECLINLGSFDVVLHDVSSRFRESEPAAEGRTSSKLTVPAPVPAIAPEKSEVEDVLMGLEAYLTIKAEALRQLNCLMQQPSNKEEVLRAIDRVKMLNADIGYSLSDLRWKIWSPPSEVINKQRQLEAEIRKEATVVPPPKVPAPAPALSTAAVDELEVEIMDCPAEEAQAPATAAPSPLPDLSRMSRDAIFKQRFLSGDPGQQRKIIGQFCIANDISAVAVKEQRDFYLPRIIAWWADQETLNWRDNSCHP